LCALRADQSNSYSRYVVSLLEMELRHLQVLVAIAEHSSFSAAADHLGTVQSNVSAHIARLEKELGATLVDRGAGRLTEEGELALARAYRILWELEALTTDVGSLRAEIAGTVRVGMIGTTARWLAPALLGDLSSSHPRLRLVVTEGPTSGLEPQLAAGRLDLAVLTHPVPGRDLVSEPLFEEQIVLVTKSDRDPTGGRESISIRDLSDIETPSPDRGGRCPPARITGLRRTWSSPSAFECCARLLEVTGQAHRGRRDGSTSRRSLHPGPRTAIGAGASGDLGATRARLAPWSAPGGSTPGNRERPGDGRRCPPTRGCPERLTEPPRHVQIPIRHVQIPI
jgi:DNA-binding transcriptional LysR family regulator